MNRLQLQLYVCICADWRFELWSTTETNIVNLAHCFNTRTDNKSSAGQFRDQSIDIASVIVCGSSSRNLTRQCGALVQ